ncbi:MAG: DinB family protein [Chitinophagaceae bacterium]|nr:DinB family protein [Chitinophagaceae bacterium]
MIKEINKKLAQEFRNTLDGDTWYSSNFTTIINEIDADTAVKKLKGFPNSIVEIVCHMTQWKIFCIKKLEGDAAFDIDMNSEVDWKRFNSLGEDEWEDIKSAFEKATIDLANAIAAAADEKLDAIVPGRKYSFLHLVIGITEHEVVHTTQISYLARLFEN